jgi:dimethylargininase
MPRAFTRAVSSRIAECQLTHLERTPIDTAKAARQHAGYEAALAQAGLEIIRLPDLPEDPDAVFVEDTALLLDGHAIVTRPGAPSRIGETGSTASGLAGHFQVHHITEGYLDGGDVMRIDQTLYVGLSTRTDEEGIAALRALAEPISYSVVKAELRDCLHLKTGATFAGTDIAGQRVLLFNPGAVDPAQFRGVHALAVSADEPSAANSLRVGDYLILPAGNPKTAAALRDRGFHVLEVDVSELQKAEAGVTCMSLIDERP